MWGNVLAHVGQRACPTWARYVPKNGQNETKITVNGEEWQEAEARTRRQYGMM